MSLRSFLFMRRHKRACKELQRIVEAQRQSFEIRDFVKRRTAALKHSRRAT